MGKILSCKEVAEKLSEDLKSRVSKLHSEGKDPTISIFRVGDDDSNVLYEKGAIKRAELLGISVKQTVLPENVGKDEIITEIQRLNQDEDIDGVLMFRPLPAHLREYEEEICNHLSSKKDIDGITEDSLLGIFVDKDMGYPPCTPAACMEILEHYGIDVTGKRVVIIGRSLVVGRPLSMMLLSKNATVTICHSKSKDIQAITKEADILIAAVGRPFLVDAGYVRPGQIVLDVGINWLPDEKRTVGDCHFGEIVDIVDAITPVPGGVGSVTTSILMKHLIDACERRDK